MHVQQNGYAISIYLYPHSHLIKTRIHTNTHSLIPSFTHSLIHSFTHSLTHSTSSIPASPALTGAALVGTDAVRASGWNRNGGRGTEEQRGRHGEWKWEEWGEEQRTQEEIGVGPATIAIHPPRMRLSEKFCSNRF